MPLFYRDNVTDGNWCPDPFVFCVSVVPDASFTGSHPSKYIINTTRVNTKFFYTAHWYFSRSIECAGAVGHPWPVDIIRILVTKHEKHHIVTKNQLTWNGGKKSILFPQAIRHDNLICNHFTNTHYGDFIMGTMASQITRLTIVYSTVNSGTNKIKHQSSASLAFMRGIDRWLVNFPHKGPVTRKMFPFDDVIMENWSM